MSFFGDLERFMSDLYPYRWLITIALIAALVAFAYFGYRRGWHVTVWRHRLASALAAAAVLAVAIPLGNYLLSPLWERSFLEEQSPLASADEGPGADVVGDGATEPAAPSPGAGDEGGAFEPRIIYRGEVSGADSFHFGRGRVLLIETAPDEYMLRFEDFSVRNGPDLFVYLTPDKDSVDGAINLGELKATDGAFNYQVPAGTDVSQFRYAIVWCSQFSVLFASAPLEAV